MESSQWPLVLPVTQSGGHGSLVKVFDFDLNSETQVCLGRKIVSDAPIVVTRGVNSFLLNE